MTRIYLAGGFQTDWQDRLIERYPAVDFEDPRIHGLSDEEDYTEWDLAAIRRSEILFGYFEASNPAGFALALEIGYAKALEKEIIYVDEMSEHGQVPSRYLGMMRAVSDRTFTSFDKAVDYVSTLIGSTH